MSHQALTKQVPLSRQHGCLFSCSPDPGICPALRYRDLVPSSTWGFWEHREAHVALVPRTWETCWTVQSWAVKLRCILVILSLQGFEVASRVALQPAGGVSLPGSACRVRESEPETRGFAPTGPWKYRAPRVRAGSLPRQAVGAGGGTQPALEGGVGRAPDCGGRLQLQRGRCWWERAGPMSRSPRQSRGALGPALRNRGWEGSWLWGSGREGSRPLRGCRRWWEGLRLQWPQQGCRTRRKGTFSLQR